MSFIAPHNYANDARHVYSGRILHSTASVGLAQARPGKDIFEFCYAHNSIFWGGGMTQRFAIINYFIIITNFSRSVHALYK